VYDEYLEIATCKISNIGFDCNCIDSYLAEVMNVYCDNEKPPCIGDVPVGPPEILDDDEADAGTTPAVMEDSGAFKEYTTELLLLLVSFPSLLLLV
jgi:hypothetical protein